MEPKQQTTSEKRTGIGSAIERQQRRFDLSINETKVLSNFDMVSVAGSLNKAVVLHYRCVADGSGSIILQCSGNQARCSQNQRD